MTSYCKAILNLQNYLTQLFIDSYKDIIFFSYIHEMYTYNSIQNKLFSLSYFHDHKYAKVTPLGSMMLS